MSWNEGSAGEKRFRTEAQSPKGTYRDRISAPAGSASIPATPGTSTAPATWSDLGWRSNIVVDRCRMLLAGFMRGAAVQGVRFLAVGRGLAAWDADPPEPPSAALTALVDPAPVLIPVQPADMAFLDAGGSPIPGPSHRLQITLTLAPGTPAPEAGEPAYPLREFGLFGNFDGEDFMIDYVRHPVIHKAPEATLVRTIRLVF